MEETAGIAELQELVVGFAGSRVHRVRVPPDRGGAFGLELGFTRQGGSGTTRTVFRWLTVHSVAWRLDRPGTEPDAVVAASGDPEQRLAEDLAVLTGREITDFQVRAPGWDTLICFGDLVLAIFPLYYRAPTAVPDWTFRMPSGKRLVVGPGARWRMAE